MTLSPLFSLAPDYAEMKDFSVQRRGCNFGICRFLNIVRPQTFNTGRAEDTKPPVWAHSCTRYTQLSLALLFVQLVLHLIVLQTRYGIYGEPETQNETHKGRKGSVLRAHYREALAKTNDPKGPSTQKSDFLAAGELNTKFFRLLGTLLVSQ